MLINYLIVNGIGVALIVFTLWWFFANKSKAQKVKTDAPIKILVKDGIYQPANIQIPAEKRVVLHFIRHDATPCAASVLFPQLNDAYDLPLNQTVEVIIPPQKPGEIEFTCQMAMYKGRLVVG